MPGSASRPSLHLVSLALASLVAALALTVAGGPVSAARLPSSPASGNPRLVRIDFGPTVGIVDLQRAGLDLYEVKRDRYALVLEWPWDADRIRALGVEPVLVDQNPALTAARRAQAELSARPTPTPARVRSAARPDGVFRTELLPPFGSGSMGGYWTLAEVKMKLDSLVAGDTEDLVANALDTLGYSIGGRPIWGLKLGKAVVGPDTRPVAFYNALTHAREPEGMQALFWFVDDLLSRYDTDAWARYLLDKRQIYIVPVVNPDGYFYNESTNAGGGGMWRKNRRNNGDGSFGVDLNRNYGWKWGLDNTGSSPTPSSDIYRGPAAFSEPETKAESLIVKRLKPRSGLSFHTYSDLFLHAWGYTPAAAPDSQAFYEYDDEATVRQGYQSGNSPRVLYSVNGEFNDWCYGDTIAKPKAFTWTPEIGNSDDGFWPAPSRIVPLAQANLRECYTVAAIAGPWVRLQDVTIVEGALNAGNAAHLAVKVRNKGLLASPAVTGTLTPIDAGIEVLSGTVPYPALGVRQNGDATGGATFWVAAHDSVTPGRLLRFKIEFTAADGTYSRDTVEVLAGTPTLVAFDYGNNGLLKWVSTGGWGIITIDASHPSRYFADSPFDIYLASINNRLILRNPPLNLSAGVHAWAVFETKWGIERNYDAAMLEASRDSVSWTPLPGRATVPGISIPGDPGVQPVGQPIYQGSRWRWAPERVDLSAFAGGAANDSVRFRFRIVSDSGTQYDGFNFDSLRIWLFDPAAQPAPSALVTATRPGRLALAPPVPNPARRLARFEFDLPEAGRVRLEVFDLQGRRVATLADAELPASRYVRGWDLRDDAGHPVAAGVYLARLSGGPSSVIRRLVVLH